MGKSVGGLLVLGWRPSDTESHENASQASDMENNTDLLHLPNFTTQWPTVN